VCGVNKMKCRHWDPCDGRGKKKMKQGDRKGAEKEALGRTDDSV